MKWSEVQDKFGVSAQYVKVSEIVGRRIEIRDASITSTRYGETIRFLCADDSGQPFVLLLSPTVERRTIVSVLQNNMEHITDVMLVRDGRTYRFAPYNEGPK